MSNNKKSTGFTIVETMIAFATAGLILLIVFMMLPTLQRNSRNSQRKNDVAVILQAISRFEISNSGDLPVSLTAANFHLKQKNLTIYDISSPTPDVTLSFVDTYTAATALLTINANSSKVIINNRQLCDASSPGHSTVKGASYHSVVALFGLETANTAVSTPQCQQI